VNTACAAGAPTYAPDTNRCRLCRHASPRCRRPLRDLASIAHSRRAAPVLSSGRRLGHTFTCAKRPMVAYSLAGQDIPFRSARRPALRRELARRAGQHRVRAVPRGTVEARASMRLAATRTRSTRCSGSNDCRGRTFFPPAGSFFHRVSATAADAAGSCLGSRVGLRGTNRAAWSAQDQRRHG
jgi:hypothetical protein